MSEDKLLNDGIKRVEEEIQELEDGLATVNTPHEASFKESLAVWNTTLTALKAQKDQPPGHRAHGLLYEMIDCFITEKREDGNGWAPVTESDMTLLDSIISGLIDAKCDRDADNDVTIEFTLINRVDRQRLYYRPLPYPSEDMSELIRYVDLAHFNLTVAMEAFNMAYRSMEYQRNLNERKEEDDSKRNEEAASV